MGKAGRHRDDRVRVDDAAKLLELATQVSHLVSAPPGAAVADGDRWLGGVATEMLKVWRDSPVVLRADPELTAALLATDNNMTVGSDWMGRFPFPAVAISLVEPLAVNDGERTCTYRGLLATASARWPEALHPEPPRRGGRRVSDGASSRRPRGDRRRAGGSRDPGRRREGCVTG